MKLLLILAFTIISFVAVAKEPHYRSAPEFHPKALHPAFINEYPHVCFDEGHHNLSVKDGRYSPILELLESDGYQVIHQSSAFTAAILKNCDVLYISAPLGANYTDQKAAGQSAFTSAEIEAIYSWVKAGGSSIVMTDHRPMSSAAEDLLNKFGVKGSIINVQDSKRMLPDFKEPGIFEISGDQLNLTSSIIKGRNESEKIHRIFFFYGQALTASKNNNDVFLKLGSEAIISTDDGHEVRSADLYSALGVAIKIGSGRFITLGDATLFTSKYDEVHSQAIGINRSGSDNVQLALNAFHWLSKVLN